MLCFDVDAKNQNSKGIDLSGAYLVGNDGIPLAAELAFEKSRVICNKRIEGPAGLALLWPIPGCETVMLETGRLMEREGPYHLETELTRGRLTRLHHKREDWGLFDYEGAEPLNAELDKARDLFVEALKTDAPSERSKYAREALKGSFLAGEKLTHYHADLLLIRRKQVRAFNRRTVGCVVDLANTSEAYRERLRESVDFVYLPIPWRALEPKKGEMNWRPFDAWIEWLTQHRIPIKMGPLVSFNPNTIPHWLLEQVDSFEKIRNVLFTHTRQLVERYNPYVQQWNVLSGIHAENTFNLNFEQLMELTRTTVSLVKQLASQSQVVVDMVSPWGEYFARNQRTIPPTLYADMVVQSGIGFDALGLQFIFGTATNGHYIRDMFQISEKLDRLGNLGKPLHITAVQVPSTVESNAPGSTGGQWWKPWNETVQAKWLKEFCTIALSKPFVESITWQDLADRPKQGLIPSGGLCKANMQPKPAYKVLQDFRSEIHRLLRKPPNQQNK